MMQRGMPAAKSQFFLSPLPAVSDALSNCSRLDRPTTVFSGEKNIGLHCVTALRKRAQQLYHLSI